MKKWHVAQQYDVVDLATKLPDINPVILRLLGSRGLAASQVAAFLHPDYRAQLHDPFLFTDMRAAVALITHHLAAGNKITVYGDYDADGVTSTAVMYKTLEFVGASFKPAPTVDTYIPHRETEGYGLNIAAVETIAAGDTKLIITVDGGIRSVAEVARAKELGMEVIITDHHEPASAKASAGKPGEGLPDCLVINPKVKDETYPFVGLAGVGVAFKVAQALLQSPELNHGDLPARLAVAPAKRAGKAGGEVFEKWLLDLVAIGTVADLMPLIDENRVFVTYGLMVLNKTRRVGLQKLIEVAQSAVDKNGNARSLDAWQIGFQLAPRLNAAGRLNHASNAYQLLVTDDEGEATRIANELNTTNQQRQQITEDIFQVADSIFSTEDKILFAVAPNLTPDPSPWQGEGNNGTKEAPLLTKERVAADRRTGEVWPAGIMGLVAGKLTEKYYRPALAITQKENKQGVKEIVGSARSISEFDVTAMLEQCAQHLTNYGGHKQAAGFTIQNNHLEEFLAQARGIAGSALRDIELVPTLEVDMELTFRDISAELYGTLNKLSPFGAGNAQPKFVSYALKVVNVTAMGADNQHLKLRLQQNGTLFDAVGFGVPEAWKECKLGDSIAMVYYIDMNEWNGNKSIQLKIIDIQKHTTRNR